MTSLEEKKKNIDNFPLISLYINPTRYCNLTCKHCWIAPPTVDKLTGQEEEMTTMEIISIVREAMKLGLSSVKFTGGEPLLRKDIIEMVEIVSDLGIEVIIETNGTLVTKPMAKVFRYSNVGHIAVSLDSFREETHDSFRGKKGAFVSAIKGIKHLTEEGLFPQIILTLYKDNMTDFSLFLSMMKDLNVKDVKINIISPVGRAVQLKESGCVPTIEEIFAFSKELEGLTENFPGHVTLDLPAAFKSLQDMKHGKCGQCALKGILGILSDGSVSICGIGYMKNDLVFGNARKDPAMLGDIWFNNPVIKKIREEVPGKLKGVCGKCVMNKRCLGICRAEVYFNQGDLLAPSSFCQEAYEKGLFPGTRLMPESSKV